MQMKHTRCAENAARPSAMAKLVLLYLAAGACANGYPAPRFGFLEPRYVGAGAPRRVVVFIHGVIGERFGTWTAKNGKVWPNMVKTEDPDLAGYDVYVFGYPSRLFGKSPSIHEVATVLGARLQDAGVFEYDEIFFVAHSMGGLITKAMLTDLSFRREDASVQRVKAVLFLSTPSKGAPLADVASLISGNTQFKEMSGDAEFNTFLARLEAQWEDLLRARDREPNIHRRWPRVLCAYEKLAAKGLVLVVSQLYLASRFDATPYPVVDASHITIAKPTSIGDDQYLWVKARILEITREIQDDAVEQRRRSGLVSLDAGSYDALDLVQGLATDSEAVVIDQSVAEHLDGKIVTFPSPLRQLPLVETLEYIFRNIGVDAVVEPSGQALLIRMRR